MSLLFLMFLACRPGESKGAATPATIGESNPTLESGTHADDSGTTPESAPPTPVPTWVTLPDVPVPVQEVAVEALDGLVYVVGGLGGSTSGLTTVWVWDGVGWAAGVPLPGAIHHANLVAFEGALYVLGAMVTGFDPVNVVWRWRPGDAAWEELAPVADGLFRGASAVGVMGDTIWVIGGSAFGSVATAFSWRPSDQVSTPLPDLPLPLDHLGGEVVDGVFYVLGGRSFGVTAVQAGVWALRPGDTSWSARAEVPTARGGVATGVLDGKIYVIGGEGNPDVESGIFPDVERYDPVADTWESLESMPTPRHGTQGAVVGNTLIVPGGATVEGVGAVTTVEALVLAAQ